MFHSLIILAVIFTSFFLLAKQASILVWTMYYGFLALSLERYSSFGMIGHLSLWLLFILLLSGSLKPIRRKVFSQFFFQTYKKAMPVMSSTEREALEAGTIGWEGDLFSGQPDFTSLRAAPTIALTPDEEAFIDGPVAKLCRMINDWEITHVYTDMPPKMWEFIKEKGFFGMIIPKEYGGLGFSATAQTIILAKIYSCSITVGSSVSVPNSLGPAELLLKYGTAEQKNYYLPRLASGQEIPCFALTGPNAGSDAASLPDKGIVCKKRIHNEEITGILLNWNKRYITLCPVATVIGLAFRLFDPENLLGKGVDVGISCALIPAETPGVIRGRRHFPLNTGFLNGPTQGKDVFIPLDYLIGGSVMAGSGWRMLMECLSAGRAISLPSSAMGGSQAAAMASGAYARVRKQFNQAIANFEGIQEPLARIAGNTYLIDAALTMTAAAIDCGAQPPVAGAILKYHTTERARQVAMDAMDIHGGKGICLGPNNYLGRGYQNAPISITVEGANILTRNLIIFGQGAIRCHPYVLREINSVRENNLYQFDEAFWNHFSFTLSNAVRSCFYSFTNARFIKVPESKAVRYYQLITQYSANLAFLADFSMMVLGGKLKRKEKISARLGDVLSNLYLASAVLKRFHSEGEPVEELPLIEWCCLQLFQHCEIAIKGIIANYPTKWARAVLKLIIIPFGSRQREPSDELGQSLARLLTEPNAIRNRLTRFVFAEPLENCPLGRLEEAFNKIISVGALERKLNQAVKEGAVHGLTLIEQIEKAEKDGILTAAEAEQLHEAELARQAAIAVDDFADEELRRHPDFLSVKKTALKAKNEDDLITEVI